MNSRNIIGIMSGTSMDGLDIIFASFFKHEKWEYTIHATEAVSFPEKLLDQLSRSTKMTAESLLLLDKELGAFIGAAINSFIENKNLSHTDIDAIASHGHTIFHQPEKGFTHQIGCCTMIALATNISVIGDFRSKDVLLGGQGAPLVPIGDVELFRDTAESYLNIGGFSNVCFPTAQPVLAYDIAPGNLPLNRIYQRAYNSPFDKDGETAKKGSIIPELLNQLNQLDFYTATPPKSIGTEWLDDYFMPLIDLNHSTEDILHTLTEHISQRIAFELNHQGVASVFITGGGAKNTFLVDRIRNHFKGNVIIPAIEIIDFKEALIFAFMGALHLNNSNTTIKSVTGASRSACTGTIFHP